MKGEAASEVNAALRSIGIAHRARAGGLLSELGLSIGQEQLLMQLAEHGTSTQAQLAKAIGCEPPTITMAVRKLEAAALVVRVQSPADARALEVALTDKGKELLPRLTAAWRQLADEAFEGISKKERPAALALLRTIAGNLRP